MFRYITRNHYKKHLQQNETPYGLPYAGLKFICQRSFLFLCQLIDLIDPNACAQYPLIRLKRYRIIAFWQRCRLPWFGKQQIREATALLPTILNDFLNKIPTICIHGVDAGLALYFCSPQQSYIHPFIGIDPKISLPIIIAQFTNLCRRLLAGLFLRQDSRLLLFIGFTNHAHSQLCLFSQKTFYCLFLLLAITLQLRLIILQDIPNEKSSHT